MARGMKKIDTKLILQFIRYKFDDSILCHSCEFDYQQRVLRTFPGSGYLRSEDGVVWL